MSVDRILDDFSNFKVWESQQDWPKGFDREEAIDNRRNIAKRQLKELIDEAVVAELNQLKTKKVKGADLVEMKWLEKRLQQLKGKE